ncbi:MAG: cytochrome c biogenesis protein CcsA [Candidatus Melainabacteria bacterium]|nr:cytochrome c biogenesis protein CcsA [Candidatus Melainabacteria bacterium]
MLALSLVSLAANANKVKLNSFEKITVLEQGRFKPLSSYARNLLLRFSGKSKAGKLNASQWLAEVIFEPAKASAKKIFLINNPEILEALEIEVEKKRRYSFDQLEPSFEALYNYALDALSKEDSKRSELDKEFLRIYTNFNSFHQLLNSFSMFLPHIDFELKHKPNILGENANLYRALLESDQVQAAVAKIDLQSKKNLASKDRELLGLGLAIFSWVETHKSFSELYAGFKEMEIIHSPNDSTDIWQAMLESGSTAPGLELLNQAYQAYLAGDQVRWDTSLFEFNQLNKLALADQAPPIQIEQIYTKLNPFGNAKFLYGLGFILLMLSFVFLPQIMRNLALGSTVVAIGLHLTGIVARMIILERAPVSNLFETFVFVSFIAALIGIAIYFWLDKNLGLLITSFVALVLLLISGKFASDGDTMQVLIAVLDSNFWLSTHVVCISIGYAGVFTAGIIAHIYLIQDLLQQNKKKLKQMSKLILAVLAFGLCFSFLGTMLGGIWADQSWGRFWGWDPKENGALLIVLWTAIIFHARLAGMIKDFGLAITSTIATVVVITSWFGINLLGVGLHSYGFTSGLALGLYIYYAIELVFIVLAVGLKQLKPNQGYQSTQ